MVWGESSVYHQGAILMDQKSSRKYDVLSVFGCFDMAGNAREWGSNPHKNGKINYGRWL
ncbi:hypothetical protein Ct9H90mP29_15860 [bacterium]|nr:MAG: hypothetical protein Ct9H90mP29_15860 [bacterium]